MTNESTSLSRQINRWKRQADTGDLPDEIYDLIAIGSSGVEKKQITNLARVSRVIDNVGEIRPYNDFKNDWNFKKSVYGKKAHLNRCLLCGKTPIVENCILVDHEAQKEIVVGSTCVYRYVEITVNGRVLEGDEKEEYLKGNMSEAKKIHRRTQFAEDWPNVMADLKRFEPMMKERRGRSYSKWGSRINWTRPEFARLHRTVSKRIVSHGYLGAKTNREWQEFMEVADQIMIEFEQKVQRLKDINERRQIEAEERRKKVAQEMNKNRNQWNAEAKSFETLTEDWINSQTTWDQQMRQRVLMRIRQHGSDRLKDGYYSWYKRAIKEVKTTDEFYRDFVPSLAPEVPLSVGRDQPIPTNPRAKKLQIVSKWMDSPNDLSKMNQWERTFCGSIKNWLEKTGDLTPAQNKSFNKILSKVNR